MAPRKRYDVVLKYPVNESDQNYQLCNRIGCSGRIKYSQTTKNGSSDKIKSSQASFLSSNGAKITRNSPVITMPKIPYLDSMKKPSSESKVDSSQKIFLNKSPSINHKNPHVSSVSKSVVQEPFNSANGNRYGLRNLKCNSISDVVRTSSSSATNGKNVLKKKSPAQENSSSGRGRKTIIVPASVVEESNTSGSVRARRSMNVNTRMMHSCLPKTRNGSFNEPSASISRISENVSLSGSSPLSRGDRSSGTLPFASEELDFMNLMNRDMVQRYNMNGIGEVLLALERMEQNEEFTHEQVLAFEASLFLGGFNLYDQHRDMRLDIDNMSYEELLALEETMGTVSTALSEEALSNCVKRCTFKATPSKLRITESGEDIKCSICQEEYVIADGMGKLVECQHEFHENCINQWLRLKNWCPICKTSAAPSSSST